jgi:hypothetical protein
LTEKTGAKIGNLDITGAIEMQPGGVIKNVDGFGNPDYTIDENGITLFGDGNNKG